MNSNSNAFYAAGLPALISTGITFIYFLLKAFCYVLHAIPHQTERGLAMTMPGCGKQKHSPTMGTEDHSEVCDKIPGRFYRTIWRRDPKILRVHFFLSKRVQDICLPSRGNAPENTEEFTFRENAKVLSGRRHQNPQNTNGKGPSNPCANPTGIFMKYGSRDHASNEQSSNDEGDGRKCDCA